MTTTILRASLTRSRRPMLVLRALCLANTMQHHLRSIPCAGFCGCPMSPSKQRSHVRRQRRRRTTPYCSCWTQYAVVKQLGLQHHTARPAPATWLLQPKHSDPAYCQAISSHFSRARNTFSGTEHLSGASTSRARAAPCISGPPAPACGDHLPFSALLDIEYQHAETIKA